MMDVQAQGETPKVAEVAAASARPERDVQVAALARVVGQQHAVLDSMPRLRGLIHRSLCRQDPSAEQAIASEQLRFGLFSIASAREAESPRVAIAVYGTRGMRLLIPDEHGWLPDTFAELNADELRVMSGLEESTRAELQRKAPDFVTLAGDPAVSRAIVGVTRDAETGSGGRDVGRGAEAGPGR